MTEYHKFADVLAEALQDPEVRAEWERTALARELEICIERCRQRETTDARLDEVLVLLRQAHVQLDRLEGTASSIEQRLEP